jgi:hypothetical protein
MVGHMWRWNEYMGAEEYKRAKILLNMSTFLQFLWLISMWCHFNGMLIMEICAYSLIWILKNLKCVKKLPISRFGWNKGCLITSFNKTTFTKGPLVFIIQFFCDNRVLLETYKEHSKFHIYNLSKTTFCLKSMSLLQHVNVMQM